MTTQRFNIAAAAVALALAGGCGSSGSSDAADAGPFTTTLRCPDIGYVPFAVNDTAWAFAGNEQAVAAQPRHKHEPSDVLGAPGVGFALTELPGDADLFAGSELIRGVMARIENNRGFFGDRIAEEKVSLWQYDDAAGWMNLGEQITDDFSGGTAGAYRFELSAAPVVGVTVRYAVLQPEPSCATHYTFNLDAGTKVVLADIDETLTQSDDELLLQVADGAYDPVEKKGAVALAQAWAAKGYQMIYLTARPHLFRSETRRWLDDHDFPVGPVITAPKLVSGDTARAYKAAWVSRIKVELGWDLVAVYGNAASDIDAYADAGIDKSVTFIIGDNAGVSGTTAIENDDYTAHIRDYVSQQPDGR